MLSVRNFWVDADVDGRLTNLGGGPRARDGGMEVVVYQREDGQIKTAFKIICRAYGSLLRTQVYMDGELIGTCESIR